jgi:hypothetical protein
VSKIITQKDEKSIGSSAFLLYACFLVMSNSCMYVHTICRVSNSNLQLVFGGQFIGPAQLLLGFSFFPTGYYLPHRQM